MATAQFSTKDKILGAAEELFATHGFAGTSLRQVTSRADVNIAAVNYHFGSKENLVNEVFRRRMDQMSAQRLVQLERALTEQPGEIEPIIAAFVEPALDMAGARRGRAVWSTRISRRGPHLRHGRLRSDQAARRHHRARTPVPDRGRADPLRRRGIPRLTFARLASGSFETKGWSKCLRNCLYVAPPFWERASWVRRSPRT